MRRSIICLGLHSIYSNQMSHVVLWTRTITCIRYTHTFTGRSLCCNGASRVAPGYCRSQKRRLSATGIRRTLRSIIRWTAWSIIMALKYRKGFRRETRLIYDVPPALLAGSPIFILGGPHAIVGYTASFKRRLNTANMLDLEFIFACAVVVTMSLVVGEVQYGQTLKLSPVQPLQVFCSAAGPALPRA